jgi:hypothetical protein
MFNHCYGKIGTVSVIVGDTSHAFELRGTC